MATQEHDNVRLHRESLEAFNRRDLDAVAASYSDDPTVTDHAQQQTMKSAEAVRAWNQDWIDAFPDGMLDIVDCIGTGEWTVARFTGRGTNDGPLAGFEPTNRRAQLELCDVARWQDGRIVEQHMYYDMYGFLAQLGHVPQMGGGS
jgi:steroid delta-isomerase-like uncharacterized protein